MPIQAPDLNQDALNKFQAQEQFPQVQEQQVRKIEIAKDTIQGQVALALEMMKAGKTPKIDVSKFPHYASNGATTPEQLKESVIAQIKEATSQDISQLPPKAQDEFIAIYNEFQKNNPGVILGKDNPYWKGIFEAVKIKNKATGDLGELKKGYDTIEKAVSQAGIAHSPRGAEGKVYRYFKYKVELLPKVDDNLRQIILEGEKEFVGNGRDGSQFYGTLLKFAGNKKILGLRLRTIKKYAPNFYKKLYDNEYPIFKKLNEIIKLDKEANKYSKEANKLKRNNDAGERILRKLGIRK